MKSLWLDKPLAHLDRRQCERQTYPHLRLPGQSKNLVYDSFFHPSLSFRFIHFFFFFEFERGLVWILNHSSHQHLIKKSSSNLKPYRNQNFFTVHREYSSTQRCTMIYVIPLHLHHGRKEEHCL